MIFNILQSSMLKKSICGESKTISLLPRTQSYIILYHESIHKTIIICQTKTQKNEQKSNALCWLLRLKHIHMGSASSKLSFSTYDRYALNNHNNNSLPEWKGTDTMVVAYIKVFQLDWECNIDEVITCQSDIDGFDFGVKKSITITSTIEPVSIRNANKVTFRATDSFEITGSFQVDSGGEMTVIMQQCPE